MFALCINEVTYRHTHSCNQISVEIKNDLSKKLAEFASYNDNLEEVFENREQIEISRYYEKLPKPDLIATQESRITPM